MTPQELRNLILQIRDEQQIAGNTHTEVGTAFDELFTYVQSASLIAEAIDNKIVSNQYDTFMRLFVAGGQYRLGINDAGVASVDFVSSEAPEYNSSLTLYNRETLKAETTLIAASSLVQEGGLWVIPPIRMIVGSAQINVATAATTIVTASVSTAINTGYVDVTGWQATCLAPTDLLKVHGGLAGQFLKLKFTVKPTSISVLS